MMKFSDIPESLRSLYETDPIVRASFDTGIGSSWSLEKTLISTIQNLVKDRNWTLGVLRNLYEKLGTDGNL